MRRFHRGFRRQSFAAKTLLELISIFLISKAPAAILLASMPRPNAKARFDFARRMKFFHLPSEAIVEALRWQRHLYDVGKFVFVSASSGNGSRAKGHNLYSTNEPRIALGTLAYCGLARNGDARSPAMKDGQPTHFPFAGGNQCADR